MAGRVEASTQGVHKTGTHAHEVIWKLEQILAAMERAHAAGYGKWGTDDFGKSFESENGYVASYENLKSVIQSQIARLLQYGEGMLTSAELLQDMELANKLGVTFE
ncbi:hypothetical protein [Nocardia iowensis]|uniref:WXG100 family type VII secretion target n=1 Tax=Nocardia iowensis TaxID=204891 RepID=A0ABX8RS81_NOCIO|nr:hypothetical protein [Nocardia iowensis]QXN92493.1 hypothetical protein KV110_04905 [Nocardia iowensis]